MPTPRQPEQEQSDALIVASTNTELVTAFEGMHRSLERAAKNSVAQQTAGQTFTAMEKKALEKVEALRLLNGWDLAALLERGRLIKEIEDDGLVGVYPGDYQTLEQLAAAVGISATEVSDTRALCTVIFPWIEANTGQPVAYWWDLIGKSKFRELVPVLQTLINGEATTGRESVRASVEHLLDGVQASATSNGEGQLPDEVLRGRAAAQVLEMGQLPTLEMRRQIRPGGTPNISGIILTRASEGGYYILRVVTPEQERMVRRLLGHHADLNVVQHTEAPRLAEQLERTGL